MTSDISFALYDSFATRRFGGNVAGVVVVRPLPADHVMQAVAAELGAPTTGFVDPAGTDPPAIRLFTPRREIDACGHVSLAVAVELVERGDWRIDPKASAEAELMTGAGRLRMRLLRAGSQVRVALHYVPRRVESAERTRSSIEEALGAQTNVELPVDVLDSGLRHLVVAFPSVRALSALRVEDAPIRLLAQSADVHTICAFATLGPGQFRMRDLTAAIGVREEPASGTTAAALAEYARIHNLLGQCSNVSIEQGVEMGRPSFIGVEWEPSSLEGGAWIIGTAIRTATGTLRCRTST